MTPQDQELIFAKVDAKVADLRTDIRLNTNGLADLKDRFGDLSGKMASVPADLAAMKAKVEALPTKDWVATMMRNWVIGAVSFLTLVTLAAKFIPLK